MQNMIISSKLDSLKTRSTFPNSQNDMILSVTIKEVLQLSSIYLDPYFSLIYLSHINLKHKLHLSPNSSSISSILLKKSLLNENSLSFVRNSQIYSIYSILTKLLTYIIRFLFLSSESHFNMS